MRFSMRWQLTLSYGLIALVASVALGLVLLGVLTRYYDQLERDYLRENAERVSDTLRVLYQPDIPPQAVQAQLQQMAFLPQTRIQMTALDGRVIADTGSPDQYSLTIDTMMFEGEVMPMMAPNEQITLNIVPRDSLPPDQVSNSLSVSQSVQGFNLLEAREERLDQVPRSDKSVRVELRNQRDEHIGHIAISEGPSIGQDIVDQVMRSWLFASVVAVCVAASIGWMISWRITTPLKNVTAVTERMAAGDLTARANIQRRDEIGILAQTFDTMATRIESMIHTLRRFVADAAHEIHTPITAIRTNLELLLERDKGQTAQTALAQLAQLQALADDLLDLSHLEGDAKHTAYASLDLREIAQQTSEIYASRAEQQDIDFLLHVPQQPLIVRGDERQLVRLLSNLLENALKFTPANGQVSLHLSAVDAQATMQVSDTGIGIPADDLPHLFERFRRGENATIYPGSGLGLAIVLAIAVAHGGTVHATSTEGTTFTIILPLMDEVKF